MSGTLLTPPPVFSLPSRFGFGLQANTRSGGRSPFDGSEQTLRQPGERWVATLAWEGLAPDEWRPLQAFITALGGRAGRFTWSPAALVPRRAPGIAGRSNLLRNGGASGAATNAAVVAPTTGLPLHWQIIGSIPAGLTLTSLGPVVVDGRAGVRFSLSGVPASTVNWVIGFERATIASGAPAAAPGQAWTGSAWLRVVAGGLTNIAVFRLRLNARTATGANIQATDTTIGTPAALTRVSATLTTPATTGLMVPGLAIQAADTTTPIAITFDICAAQLERSATATADIPTSGETATVAEGPFVLGAGQTGSALALRGWLAEAQAARAGDLIGFVDATNRPRLHMATADTTAAEDGTCSLPIAPPLRSAPANGAAVSVTSPAVIWGLLSDRSPMDITRGLMAGGTLDIEEKLL